MCVICLCEFVCVLDIISQVVLWVRSSVRAHRGYLHPSLVSYPGGTESPGGEGGKRRHFPFLFTSYCTK